MEGGGRSHVRRQGEVKEGTPQSHASRGTGGFMEKSVQELMAHLCCSMCVCEQMPHEQLKFELCVSH